MQVKCCQIQYKKKINSSCEVISYTVGFVSRKRSFLQSDLAVENDRFRLKPKSSFLNIYTVETELFRLNFEFFDWICQSENSVEKVFHLFFNPSHPSIPPQNTHPHAHTPIPGTTHPYQVPHNSIIQQRRRCLGYHCCSFSPQVSVVHS